MGGVILADPRRYCRLIASHDWQFSEQKASATSVQTDPSGHTCAEWMSPRQHGPLKSSSVLNLTLQPQTRSSPKYRPQLPESHVLLTGRRRIAGLVARAPSSAESLAFAREGELMSPTQAAHYYFFAYGPPGRCLQPVDFDGDVLLRLLWKRCSFRHLVISSHQQRLLSWDGSRSNMSCSLPMSPSAILQVKARRQ